LEYHVNILLLPATAGYYLTYTPELNAINYTYHHSDCIDFIDVASIAAKTSTGAVRHFIYFNCFESCVWYLIILSIILLSLTSSQKLSYFLQYLWNYFLILFTKSLQNFLLKSTVKSIIGLWLLSALVLSIQFTNYILDYMSTAAPILTIDSLETLAKHSEMKIGVQKDNALVQFIQSHDTELTNTLRQQLSAFDDYEEVKTYLPIGLRNGSLVYINCRLFLIFDLMEMTQNEDKSQLNDNKRLIDLMHISDENGGLEPYFMFVSQTPGEWALNGLNRM
jgi:hypothetical protein